MNKCVKITLSLNNYEEFCQNRLHQLASKFNLEGLAQPNNDIIKIVACGKKDRIDNFIDTLNKEYNLNNIEIEPFLKDKDYRGIFRIIE